MLTALLLVGCAPWTGLCLLVGYQIGLKAGQGRPMDIAREVRAMRESGAGPGAHEPQAIEESKRFRL